MSLNFDQFSNLDKKSPGMGTLEKIQVHFSSKGKLLNYAVEHNSIGLERTAFDSIQGFLANFPFQK